MGTPPLLSLYINVTDGCNLGCGHCWIDPARSGSGFEPRPAAPREMGARLVSRLVGEALELGLQSVKLTGGEPLLRSDFPEVYARVRGMVGCVMVETNGTVVPRGFWQAVEESPPDEVAVSLDSSDPERHDRLRGAGGAWERTVSFVRGLVARDIYCQLIMSVDSTEVTPVLEMARFADGLGVSSLKVNLVQPVGRGASGVLHSMPAGEVLGFASKVHAATRGGVSVDLPQAFLTGRRLMRNPRCGILNLLGVLADGSFSFCGIGVTRPELVMGSYPERSLRSVWEGSELLRELRGLVPEQLEEPCAGCIHMRGCMGKCVMQNYSETGRLTSSHWLCRRALEEGRFPETRRLPGR